MKPVKNLQSCQYEISEGGDNEMTLHMKGKMDASSASPLIRRLTFYLRDRLPSLLIIDMEKVTYLDDFGMLVLLELRDMIAGAKGRFQLINTGDKVDEILSIHNFASFGERVSFAKRSPPGMFVRLGDATIRHFLHLKELIIFMGSVCLALVHVCLHPKSLRVSDTITNMQRTGVDALPIVGLISFLLGLIMAFMSSVQLQQFGANIYVASLVSLAMTRELGPIMTTIIVAGRSGSAYATEIGTMKISEEVDALFTMGFEKTNFLVIPKIIASIIVVPLLTLFSDVFAILGGLVVGVFMLDLTTNAYMAQTIKTLTLFDVFWGFFKSGIFALFISCISSFRGFQVEGGAASVGLATTSAVVSSIFLIILSDSIFSVILRYWG
jgi:phospholipid/cholesterol/gamma-HCH transport system permease protein